MSTIAYLYKYIRLKNKFPPVVGIYSQKANRLRFWCSNGLFVEECEVFLVGFVEFFEHFKVLVVHFLFQFKVGFKGL